MTAPWLIIADDLSSAADCAIAFANRNLETVVTWGESTVIGAPVVSVDAGTRRMRAKDAAARQAAVFEARATPAHHLFKTIDSTLRGQPAAETAAILTALRKKKRERLAFVAPAFPATGRTVEDGRVMVDGRPLEESPLWKREHTYDNGMLAGILEAAELRTGVIPREQLRGGASVVRGAVSTAIAEGCDAVVCDAVTEDDLRIAAEATLPLSEQLLFVGTSGLASALAALLSPSCPAQALAVPSPGHIMVLVGSLAEPSRKAADLLAKIGRVRTFSIPEAALLDDGKLVALRREITAKIGAAVSEGDVLVATEFGPKSDPARGLEVADRFADIVVPATVHLGGLIVTGGDTVYAVLGRLGVTGIRLVEEMEPGVPVGVTIGAVSLPLITKAGEFGNDHTLDHCLTHLHEIIGH